MLFKVMLNLKICVKILTLPFSLGVKPLPLVQKSVEKTPGVRFAYVASIQDVLSVREMGARVGREDFLKIAFKILPTVYFEIL